MDLTPLENRQVIFSLCLIVSILSLAAQGFSQAEPCVNQSPRDLKIDLARLDPPAHAKDFDFVSRIPLVKLLPSGKLLYQRQELVACDIHYHLPVENLQGCPDETKELGLDERGRPRKGQWVEVHRVFALKNAPAEECLVVGDHELACCAVPPFVVMAHSFRVSDHSNLSPEPDTDEWSGSTTGKEDPTGCKSTPAQWSFALFGCQAESIVPDQKPHVARKVPAPNNVSSDLTFVASKTTSPDQMVARTCRMVKTAPIQDDAAAQRICPGVCKSPLNSPLMVNGSVVWSNKQGYAVCTCCPLERPQ